MWAITILIIVLLLVFVTLNKNKYKNKINLLSIFGFITKGLHFQASAQTLKQNKKSWHNVCTQISWKKRKSPVFNIFSQVL